MSRKYNNSIGTIGLVFACLAMAFFWLPILGGLFWLIGAVMSCIGLGYRNSTQAWFGFWISLVWLACYVCFGIIFSTFTYLTIYPLYIW